MQVVNELKFKDMDKKDYLQFCRYYKGEETNPYEGKDMNKATLWFYESAWLHEMQEIQQDEKKEKEHTLFTYMDEYVNYGLSDFEMQDDTPASLKALLFNRYSHWNSADIDGFKKWYKSIYKGEG